MMQFPHFNRSGKRHTATLPLGKTVFLLCDKSGKGYSNEVHRHFPRNCEHHIGLDVQLLREYVPCYKIKHDIHLETLTGCGLLVCDI
jgi:hypothetical protein